MTRRNVPSLGSPLNQHLQQLCSHLHLFAHSYVKLLYCFLILTSLLTVITLRHVPLCLYRRSLKLPMSLHSILVMLENT